MRTAAAHVSVFSHQMLSHPSALPAVDEQNAQTQQQQQVFSLGHAHEDGLVEEEEDDELLDEDKMSLQSSYSSKHRSARRGQWTAVDAVAAHPQVASDCNRIVTVNLCVFVHTQSVRHLVRSSSVKAACHWAALHHFLSRQEVERTCLCSTQRSFILVRDCYVTW